MTANNLITEPVHGASLVKRMSIGAIIALALISLYLIGVKDPDQAWGKYWMLKPLLMVPAAGAMGGLFYHFMDHLRCQGGWKTVFSVCR